MSCQNNGCHCRPLGSVADDACQLACRLKMERIIVMGTSGGEEVCSEQRGVGCGRALPQAVGACGAAAQRARCNPPAKHCCSRTPKGRAPWPTAVQGAAPMRPPLPQPMPTS